MGLGVLEDHKLEHVPGTANVYESEERHRLEQTTIDPSLKYDRSGPVPIILVPQPSDDPEDPLNLPLWRRDLILFVLSLLSVIASTLSPLLAANTLYLSLYFRRTFNAMALLTGYHLLGVAIAGILFVPSSRVWGKRHTFIIGTIFVIFSSAWGGAAGKNYTSLLWARVFQGIGLAPFEALVNAVVGDLYFVHERGKRMAMTNFAVFGGAFFTPVIVGKMTHSIGWEWTFWFVAIFAGVLLPVVILWVPETAFRRAAHWNTDIGTSNRNSIVGGGGGIELSGNQQKEEERNIRTGNASTDGSPVEGSQNGLFNKDIEKGERNIKAGNTSIDGAPAEGSQNGSFNKDIEKESSSANGQVAHEEENNKTTPKQGFFRRLIPPTKQLRPFNGRKTDESYWKLFLRPFPLFCHPSILWACLIQGTLIGWTVFLGIVLAAIMLGPPLFFNEVETGYMYTGAFIGAVVGFALSGLLADWSARWLTRRNGGVYEPEFRLPLVIPQLVLGCAGLYGFGITAAKTGKYGWFWPDFFFALEVAGMVVGAVASALYIVDAHRDIAIEAFTCMMVFKNVFSFGLTWSGYQWLSHTGIEPIFTAVASVQVGVCMLTVLLYIFGKRNRSFFARHDILNMCHLW